MDKAISILSGGLDSAVSTSIALQHHNVIKAVTFDYSQKALAKEVDAAHYFCKNHDIEHIVIKLDFFSEIGKSALITDAEIPEISEEELKNDKLATLASAEQVWVPNRNGIFINIAAAISEKEDIQWMITGFNKEEAVTFPDNSARYVDLVNSCLAESTLSKPQVVSYVKKMNKVEIVNEARDLNIDIEKIWCCYHSRKKWCGKCESCVRTISAMKEAEVYNDYKDCFG